MRLLDGVADIVLKRCSCGQPDHGAVACNAVRVDIRNAGYRVVDRRGEPILCGEVFYSGGGLWENAVHAGGTNQSVRNE